MKYSVLGSVIVTLLLTGSPVSGADDLCSQSVNITSSNTVVIISAGNISFHCDFDGNSVISWMLNGRPLLNTSGTLDIYTDELLNDTPINYLQCYSSDIQDVYNTTLVLVTSEDQIKFCSQPITRSVPTRITDVISTASTPNVGTTSGHSITTTGYIVMATGTPPALCGDLTSIAGTVPFIAVAAIGGTAVLVMVCMVMGCVCSCCCHRKRTNTTSTMGVVVNPLAWERSMELTPFDLNQSSFSFSPKTN